MSDFYLAALSATNGLGRRTILNLMTLMPDPKAIWDADAATLLAAGTKESAVNKFLQSKKLELPEQLERKCRLHGVELITFLDKAYPERLREIHDAPLVLYVKGSLPQEPYAMAVVGSRETTEYGQEAAKMFAYSLAKAGLPIISGGAKGIDSVAHRAALEAGGKTVAVFGCGIDVVYPRNNAGLFNEILAKGGALVTEFPFGTPPAAENFPMRNRIIVGLSQGVIVAQAMRKSGAVLTANIAADEGRDVYCVPGNIFEGRNVGCHDLIRNGAQLVDSPEDILEELNQWHGYRKEKLHRTRVQDSRDMGLFAMSEKEICPSLMKEQNKINKNESTVKLEKLNPLARQLYKEMVKPQTLENLVEITQSNLAEVGVELLELQMLGLIKQDAAMRYYRN